MFSSQTDTEFRRKPKNGRTVNMNRLPQKDRLLIHLFENGYVTIEDQRKLQLTRLAAVVLQLKKLGVAIDSIDTKIESKYQTSTVSMYFLA